MHVFTLLTFVRKNTIKDPLEAEVCEHRVSMNIHYMYSINISANNKVRYFVGAGAGAGAGVGVGKTILWARCYYSSDTRNLLCEKQNKTKTELKQSV